MITKRSAYNKADWAKMYSNNNAVIFFYIYSIILLYLDTVNSFSVFLLV